MEACYERGEEAREERDEREDRSQKSEDRTERRAQGQGRNLEPLDLKIATDAMQDCETSTERAS